MKKNSIGKQLLFYVLVIGVIVLLGSLLYSRNGQGEADTYDDILNYFHNEQVVEVEITPKNVLLLQVDENGDGVGEKSVSYKLRA